MTLRPLYHYFYEIIYRFSNWVLRFPAFLHFIIRNISLQPQYLGRLILLFAGPAWRNCFNFFRSFSTEKISSKMISKFLGFVRPVSVPSPILRERSIYTHRTNVPRNLPVSKFYFIKHIQAVSFALSALMVRVASLSCFNRLRSLISPAFSIYSFNTQIIL